VPAKSTEKIHLVLIIVFVCFGAIGLLSFFLWISLDNPFWGHLSQVVGVWFFLLPLIITVCHLVIPFFTKMAIANFQYVDSLPILWMILAAVVVRGLLEGIGVAEFFWIPDLVLFVFAVYLSIVWNLRISRATHMLFMLHLSFLWLSVGLFLDFIQSLAFELSHGSVFILGHAPLHALTIGFFASMVVGLSTRVTLGHSGEKVRGDASPWRIFLMLQGSAIFRLLAEIFPAGSLMSLAGYAGSALLWLAGFSAWIFKYGSLLWGSAAH